MKMRRLIMKLVIWIAAPLAVALSSSSAHADALVPATSEDIDQFDHQIAAEKQFDKGRETKRERKDNFSSTISAEARSLNRDESDGKKRFGQWVNSQNPANNQSRGSRDEGASTGSSGTGPGNSISNPGNSGASHGGGRGRGKK